VSIAKSIMPNLTPPITITAIHCRRFDPDTEAREKAVVMMVMVVVLHQLQQRLGPLSLSNVVRHQD
jgi:hypothetical protein